MNYFSFPQCPELLPEIDLKLLVDKERNRWKEFRLKPSLMVHGCSHSNCIFIGVFMLTLPGERFVKTFNLILKKLKRNRSLTLSDNSSTYSVYIFFLFGILWGKGQIQILSDIFWFLKNLARRNSPFFYDSRGIFYLNLRQMDHILLFHFHHPWSS